MKILYRNYLYIKEEIILGPNKNQFRENYDFEMIM